MINNHVLRSIRYMLDLGDAKVVDVMRLADPAIAFDKAQVQAFLQREEDPAYVELDDRTLAAFLDGLVIHRRGRNEGQLARAIEKRLSNNLILKKLRIAFELKDDDMHRVFDEAGFPVSKPELSALFRQPGHQNYRKCGDQMLRNFLRGLTLSLRPT